MKKKLVINKRIVRELKQNIARYVSLLGLITIGMSVIIGLSVATDSILYTVKKFNDLNNVEDGQFTTFVPLTAADISKIEDKGITVEKNFFVDILMDDESILRIFKDRKNINKVWIEKGKLPDKKNNIVLEKHYAEKNNFIVGNTISVGGNVFEIVGIGTIPDYNYVKKNASDVGSDTSKFSIGIVLEDVYNELKENENVIASEEFCYSFKLNNAMEMEEFRNFISEFSFDSNQVTDEYLMEVIDRVESNKNKLQVGIKKLADGAEKLVNGTGEFVSGSEKLLNGVSELKDGTSKFMEGINEANKGAEKLVKNGGNLTAASVEIFDAMLESTNKNLKENGINTVLTKDNYADQINQILQNGDLSLKIKDQVTNLKTDLAHYNEFYTGLDRYASGVGAAKTGSETLLSGMQEAGGGIGGLAEGIGKIDENTIPLQEGAEQIFDGVINNANQQLYFYSLSNPALEGVYLTRDGYENELEQLFLMMGDQVPQELWDLKFTLDSCKAFYNGLIEYSNGVSLLNKSVSEAPAGMKNMEEGVSTLAGGLKELDENSSQLLAGANEVYAALVATANIQMNNAGIQTALTKDNHNSELENLLTGGRVNEAAEKILTDTKQQLGAFSDFNKGLEQYVNGVNELHNGLVKLNTSGNELNDGVISLQNGTEELFEKSEDLHEGTKELRSGVYELEESVNSLAEEFFNFKYENIATFLSGENNSRLNDYKEDTQINKTSAMVIGIVFLILVAYVVAVFVVENIEKESRIIGTLYSLGYNKNVLLYHYILLPSTLIGLAGFVGTFVGVIISPFLTKDSTSLYSYPKVETIYSPYIIIYGIVLPVFVAVIVNMIQINSKLSVSPLKLLNNEKKIVKYSSFNLKKFSYVNKFKIRQYFREIRSHLVLSFGLFLSILLMIFGFTIFGSIQNMTAHMTDDIRFNYMYLLKYPPKEVPENAEPSFTKTLFTEYSLTDSMLEITLQGIGPNNPYIQDVPEDKKNDIFISSSVQSKFGWEIGQKIILSDTVNESDYIFIIKGIIPYSNGLYVFMNLNSMREFFGEDAEYYNTLLSMDKIEIDSERILSITTKDDIQKVADVFMQLMSGLIVMVVSLSIVLYIIVSFLLLKAMTDKASMDISLLKVLGFERREIMKMYVGSNSITVALTAFVGIPIGKRIVDAVYPYMVSNVAMGFDFSLSPKIYILILLIILGSYLIVNIWLSGRLNKVNLALILKSKE